MTCGFFIVSLPCIPKLLKETGAGPKIKRALGMSASRDTPKRNYWESDGTVPPSNHSRLAGSTATSPYYKLDPLKASESTEYLHHGAQDTGITRTTKITVTRESPSEDRDLRYMYP